MYIINVLFTIGVLGFVLNRRNPILMLKYLDRDNVISTY